MSEVKLGQNLHNKTIEQLLQEFIYSRQLMSEVKLDQNLHNKKIEQ